MANLNSLPVQDELTLIEICQRILGAPSKAALTQIEKRFCDRAFAELLSRYNRWIWKQINSISRLDPDDAYSAALEGFQKAIATFDLTSGNALASWAKHCVRGALATVLRNQQGQAARVEKLKATTTLVYEDEPIDPYEEEQLHQCVEKLHQASSLLSETAQQIVLKRNEGMKFRAIGAELGKSADAVRMAYNRAITALGGMLTQQPESVVVTQPESVVITQPESVVITQLESVVTTHKPPTVLQEEQLQSTFQAPENNWMKSLWERCKLNVRSFKRVPILSRTVRGKPMTKQLSSSTRPFINKPRNTLFTKFLDSPALKYISWLTVALLVLYRVLWGDWLVLLVCGVGGTLLALFWQHYGAIKKRHRRQLLFCLCTVLSWCLFTIHSPAYALFFDTLETGLTSLFARFNVTEVESIPLWIGGVFRLLGIVFLGILAIRFGRSREDDDEGTKAIVGKVVQIICGLLVFDVLIELFTG